MTVCKAKFLDVDKSSLMTALMSSLLAECSRYDTGTSDCESPAGDCESLTGGTSRRLVLVERSDVTSLSWDQLRR